MSSDHVILWRSGFGEDGELAAAAKHFGIARRRSDVDRGATVIGRYSVLPGYDEVWDDLRYGYDAELINTCEQHAFLANCEHWASVLGDDTPQPKATWDDLPRGAYILKGRTNSKKWQWNTHMFAATREDVSAVVRRLLEDSRIEEQGIVVRPYVPLQRLGEGLNGLPIANEWRIFVCYGQILCGGFYWASHPELEPQCPADRPEGFDSARALIQRARRALDRRARFYTIDIARTLDGRWIVVDVNDGQMSGLCTIDPDEFYAELRAAIEMQFALEQG